MVKIISDYGYCYGILSAIDALRKNSAKKKNVYFTKPLFLEGVENDALMKKNHVTTYKKGVNVKANSAVVFPVHGHSLAMESPFQGKSLMVDVTCPVIMERYFFLARPLEDVTYLFLGAKGETETEAFLSHFPFLVFVDSNGDVEKQLSSLPLKEKTILVAQTTCAEKAYSLAYAYLSDHSNLILDLHICPFYRNRAYSGIRFLKEAKPGKTYFVVVADKESQNGKQIFDTIHQAFPAIPGRIALSPEELNPKDYRGKDVYVFSAVSVSKERVEAMAKALEK
jgi:4-hydroxy-3-methylbut-2-enyl diphosphate reductase IspH